MTDNSELIIPSTFEEVLTESTPTHGKFVISPYESGYGHTIGNALRRVLLSSLEGAAISSVEIEGIDHEFCAVPDVKEDVTEIVLNLKKVKLNIISNDQDIVLEINKTVEGKNGEVKVTAGDIETAMKVEILNPDLVICTLDPSKNRKASFNARLQVQKGRGWKPADRYPRSKGNSSSTTGLIYVDSLFSPVNFVRYQVTNTRYGDNTEMDCLTIEIDTDMRISPRKALEEAAKILKSQLRPFLGAQADATSPASDLSEDDRKLYDLLCKSVDVLKLSVRSANCLKQKDIRTIGDLCLSPENNMMSCRNFGKKSLQEVCESLASYGLKLGMEMSDSLKKALKAKADNEKSKTLPPEEA